MRTRIDFDNLLKSLLGSSNVYFQPPSGFKLIYPCIVYERSDIRTKFGDNIPYINRKEYTVTHIDKDPDSIVPDKIKNIESCIFDRHFTSGNLNHDVFNILY